MALARSWTGAMRSFPLVENFITFPGGRHSRQTKISFSGHHPSLNQPISVAAPSGSQHPFMQCTAAHSILRVPLSISSHQNGGCRKMFRRSITTVIEKSAVLSEYGNENQVFNFSSGKFGIQADGSCNVRQGETNVLAIAVNKTRFLPQDVKYLTTEYRERAFAGNFIPSNYHRQDRGSTREDLVGSLADAAIRPLLRSEVASVTQIVLSVLSADGVSNPDVLAINGASAALCMSDIPFAGPVAAIRLGLQPGTNGEEELIINPTVQQMQTSQLDMIYAGTKEGAIVVDLGSSQGVSCETLDRALRVAHQSVQPLLDVQLDMMASCDKNKDVIMSGSLSPAARRRASAIVGPMISDLMQSDVRNSRQLWDQAINEIREYAAGIVRIHFPLMHGREVDAAVAHALTQETQRFVFYGEGLRADGRALDGLREIATEIAPLPFLHGSSLFACGETQVLGVTTCDDKSLHVRVEDVETFINGKKASPFSLVYEEPSYASNDVELFSFNRQRQEGSQHRSFAQRAFDGVIPKRYPLAIRTVAEVTGAHGATVTAAVNAASMSLFNAGVPMQSHVSAVSLGVLLPEAGADGGGCTGGSATDGDARVLVDTTADEEECVDMLMHVAGTKKSITACYACATDARAIPLDALISAIHASTAPREQIHLALELAIKEPNPSPKAPLIKALDIPERNISKLIGPAGATIKGIEMRSGGKIHIERDDVVEGCVQVIVTADDNEGLDLAVQSIREATAGDGTPATKGKAAGRGAPREQHVDRYIRFPRGKATSRFIGKRGENVRKLEEQTLTRLSFMQDRLTLRIRAKTASEADRAVRAITKHVGEAMDTPKSSMSVSIARKGQAAAAAEGPPLRSPLVVCVSDRRVMKQDVTKSFGLKLFLQRLDRIEAATGTMIEFDHKAGIVQLVATSAHGLEMANNAIDALELPGAEDVDST
eukprot:m.1051558 g.1051558  ORF g.1051558 m.1051558 type:complete len:943 (-) comp24178_c0_seq20:1641-4469(-)